MSDWSSKSDLEKAITAGIHGNVEFKKEERLSYLGFFRDRIIEAVTFNQLRDEQGRKAIMQALKDGRAHELVVHNRARMAAMPLISAARQAGVDFTIATNPQFKGKVALIVVAKNGIESNKCLLADREEGRR